MKDISFRLPPAPLDSWGLWSLARPTSTTSSRFTLEEIKVVLRDFWSKYFVIFLVQIISYQAAGLSKKFARTIGIAVDHRRRYEMFKFSLNCWWRQFKNMRTSETRMWSLCSWTHRGWKSSSRRWSWTGQAKPRKGDATAEEMSKAVQLAGTKVTMSHHQSETLADFKF